MNRALKLLTITAVFLLAVPSIFAQNPPNGSPNGNYGGFPMDVQSRNIPAGTVVDPGSQLLYIVDTGVNMRTDTNFTDAEKAANNVNSLTGIDGTGGGAQTNFIAITNTHPTQAVTVHFRYFNDMCEDVLDFLVVLTCNDTLLFDPFNFEIPGTSLNGNPINTKNRIFGPSLDANIFPAISANTFSSGRFLIFATAAGTANDLANGGSAFPSIFDPSTDTAQILFPNELGAGLNGECNIDATGSTFDPAFPATAGEGEVQRRNVGLAPDLVATNLHVFNASAVSFNYLTGFWTTAVPKGFIEGVQSDQDRFLAFGVNAWTRPAVDLSTDDNDSIFPTPESQGTGGFNAAGDTDGDGIFVSDYLLLAGSEVLKSSNTQSDLGSNLYYLRNDVHGGDTQRATAFDATLEEPPFGVGGTSDYGALAWISLFPVPTGAGTGPENQRLELLSIVDDYNGSQNTGTGIQVGATTITDRSYNLTGAQTRYILQIYDNNEDKLNLSSQTPINISPPPAVAPTADLRIIVDCLKVFIGPTAATSLIRDGLSVANLNEITSLVLDGNGAFDGYNSTVNAVTTDGSQGWIRLVRDNQFTRSGIVGSGANAVTRTITGGTIAPVNSTIMDNSSVPTFVTIGQAVVRFEGFGASYWLSTSAVDPRINNAPTTTASP